MMLPICSIKEHFDVFCIDCALISKESMFTSATLPRILYTPTEYSVPNHARHIGQENPESWRLHGDRKRPIST